MFTGYIHIHIIVPQKHTQELSKFSRERNKKSFVAMSKHQLLNRRKHTN